MTYSKDILTSKPIDNTSKQQQLSSTSLASSSIVEDDIKTSNSVALLIPQSLDDYTPFIDPKWVFEWHSPYFNETHKIVLKSIRSFVETHITPNVSLWDENKIVPREVLKLFAREKWLAAFCGPPWPTHYLSTCCAAIPHFNHFHEQLITDSLAKCGSGGVTWLFALGLSVGLPPIMKYGSEYIQNKYVKKCLLGEQIICLAITEPYAGSDVASIQTTAKRSECGKFYVLNGEKKWITNGVFADLFTVAARTSESKGGISLFVVERSRGVKTRQMACQGMWASGTAYVTFEDVKVPIENLIGKENEGFKYVMQNFNHERWSLCIQCLRFSRICLSESVSYAFKHKTFGKLLIEHPVVRSKIAKMTASVEATQSLLDLITYQMTQLSYADSARLLGGSIALLKAQCTQVFEYCAREALQIFGGAGYTRNGEGEMVERLYREVRAYAIPGGSEEIMLDFGIRQSVKQYQNTMGLNAKL